MKDRVSLAPRDVCIFLPGKDHERVALKGVLVLLLRLVEDQYVVKTLDTSVDDAEFAAKAGVLLKFDPQCTMGLRPGCLAAWNSLQIKRNMAMADDEADDRIDPHTRNALTNIRNMMAKAPSPEERAELARLMGGVTGERA